MNKPKECVNNNCKKIMYVPDYKLHMLLQCDKCIEKNENKKINIY
jgi:hypothetical protein